MESNSEKIQAVLNTLYLEFSKEAKNHINEVFNDIPELTNILTAIDVIKKYYPELELY